jgi:hypothetical protein
LSPGAGLSPVQLTFHRSFDLATLQPDIAELKIVQPAKRFDRFSTYPIAGKAIPPGR